MDKENIKSNIINELKNLSSEKKISDEKTNEIELPKTNNEKTNNDFNGKNKFKKNKFKKNKFKKNKFKKLEIEENSISIEKPVSIYNAVEENENRIIESNEFEKFKEKFQEEEINKEFLDYMEKALEMNNDVFSINDFLEERFKHKKCKVLITDPSIDDLALGKGEKWWLLKPIYIDEYMDFIKNYGTKDQFPKEFMKYAIENGILLPKISKEEGIDKIPTGTLMTIYRLILDISDFNKKYKVLEV